MPSQLAINFFLLLRLLARETPMPPPSFQIPSFPLSLGAFLTKYRANHWPSWASPVPAPLPSSSVHQFMRAPTLRIAIQDLLGGSESPPVGSFQRHCPLPPSRVTGLLKARLKNARRRRLPLFFSFLRGLFSRILRHSKTYGSLNQIGLESALDGIESKFSLCKRV